MRGALHRSGNSGSKQLAASDQLLIAGIKLGPAKKRDAINRVLQALTYVTLTLALSWLMWISAIKLHLQKPFRGQGK